MYFGTKRGIFKCEHAIESYLKVPYTVFVEYFVFGREERILKRGYRVKNFLKIHGV